MITIDALELRTATIIRRGLREAMRNANPHDIDATLRQAGDRLIHVLYEPLYDQIMETYRVGYIAGGELIRRYAPRGTLLTAAAPITTEDPRIVKATENVIFGVKGSLNGHKDEIQAVIRAQIEKGAMMPQITDRLMYYFDDDRVATDRFARTAITDIYNRAHLDRYEDSGVVDGVQYSAHIDNRTSEICQLMNMTIWAIGDPNIQVPPMHFSCRSSLLPYWGRIPGKRNFKKDFDSDFIKRAEKTRDVFRSKYWSPMPHTKASATFQRSYFTKKQLKTINKGLNLAIKEERKTKTVPDIIPLERLKTMLRYRKIDPNKSTIIDRFGKSVLLDNFEENDITKGMKALISDQTHWASEARSEYRSVHKFNTEWRDNIRMGVRLAPEDMIKTWTGKTASLDDLEKWYEVFGSAERNKAQFLTSDELALLGKWGRKKGFSEKILKEISLSSKLSRYDMGLDDLQQELRLFRKGKPIGINAGIKKYEKRVWDRPGEELYIIDKHGNRVSHTLSDYAGDAWFGDVPATPDGVMILNQADGRLIMIDDYVEAAAKLNLKEVRIVGKEKVHIIRCTGSWDASYYEDVVRPSYLRAQRELSAKLKADGKTSKIETDWYNLQVWKRVSRECDEIKYEEAIPTSLIKPRKKFAHELAEDRRREKLREEKKLLAFLKSLHK